ncbi:MAG TPA: glycosyl hydrolase [Thermoanaerobaculia bacterium]|nr:glycosyl hydrolase [Thermoanaerobaculia bacterium]
MTRRAGAHWLTPALLTLLLLVPAAAGAAPAQDDAKADEKEPELLSAGTFTGLALRSIGPAVTSGRIVDLAIHPDYPGTWWIAVASGGVWKSDNAGTTWRPVFDGQSSYSIGCLAIDPENPEVVWVGTGENNSQRSVSYGDGVYKTTDGGRTWKNVGLKDSEHIGRIVIDPRDTDTVLVAAQGPLWSSGGDRGLYKTTDGGETWKKVLEVSPDTGVSDLVYDPRNPDLLYASAYQRRRHVWTLINGGPESAVYRSTDGGETWNKLEQGLPRGDVGRIGLAVSPVDPDVVYAVIEAADEKSAGFYRSTDRGASWERRSGYVSGSPQYYQEIFADPHDRDRVWSMDTWLMVTEDGGASFERAPQDNVHVDHHAFWIDPEDPDHLITGNDGGLYETFDRGGSWRFVPNLPITQFYKIAVDDAEPFYNVYGGTQDNFTLGGPTQTTSASGIVNSDWFVTVGGDGFQPRIEPGNPDIVYSQSQYGNLVRFDRASGELLDIQPQPAPGDEPLKWNWDSPLIISPHSKTRLYFGANRLFRSEDRGSSWRAVSPDLTRKIDRNQLPVMGRIQSIDAVAKNASTSFYGNIVALSESPLVEDLLYVGTDDGLVQVSEDGGSGWRQVETFPGVPERTYVSRLEASRHDPDTVYAAFDNHKMGDFKPYVLRSTDRGRTWASIAGDLPERGSVYALVQDAEDAGLLFAGTEFGVFFTPDGGGRWIQLKGGIPTIIVRDLATQDRETDLVVGTFGRGFYVLDDYSPLRNLTEERLEAEAVLYPVEDPWMYMPGYTPLGIRGPGFQGASYFTAPNPPFGAVFTYYLKEGLTTRREERRETEKEALGAKKRIGIPSWDALREEAREKEPKVLLTVRDETGEVVRRLTGPARKGFHRVAWDLRYPPATPVSLRPPPDNPFFDPPAGPPVAPGTYTVELALVKDDEARPVAPARSFTAKPLGLATLPAEDRAAVAAFQRRTAELQRAVMGTVRAADEAQTRIDHLRQAVLDTPGAEYALLEELRAVEERLADVRIELQGDPVVGRYNEPTPPSVVQRTFRAVYGHWGSSSGPTDTHRASFDAAADAFADVLARLRTLVETDLAGIESRLEELGAPWTPGRLPAWEPPQGD